MRQLTYVEAIREAHAQLLSSDSRVFIAGQGLWSPWYAGGSLDHLDRDFGRERVIDSPVSENAVTGMCVGAALAGMRPIVFHPRMDFMLLAVDPHRKSSSQLVLYFCGPRDRPARHSRRDQSRRRARGATFPGPARNVHAYPGIKSRHAGDSFRRQGIIGRRCRGSEPGPIYR